MLGHRESKNVYRYKDLRFWAENGMITIVNEREGNPGRITTQDFLDRAKALALEIPHDVYPSEKRTKTKVVEDMLKCAEEAIAQGDPTDPKVQAHHSRHQSHKKTNILVPDLGNLSLPVKQKLIL